MLWVLPICLFGKFYYRLAYFVGIWCHFFPVLVDYGSRTTKATFEEIIFVFFSRQKTPLNLVSVAARNKMLPPLAIETGAVRILSENGYVLTTHFMLKIVHSLYVTLVRRICHCSYNLFG
jgi:hypothetical protein